ncbi:MAG TPA: ATP-binding protein [Coriobacteriia bacterium]
MHDERIVRASRPTLDRLLHHVTVVNIRGQSYRMRAHIPSPREGAAMLG